MRAERPVPVARRSLRLLLILALTAGAAACHEEGQIKVRSVTFSGNRAFKDGQLAAVLATRKSGWLPFSRKQYFDRADFDRDLTRIVTFYTDRGYPHAKVVSFDAALNDKKDAVSVRIEIDEGLPTLVESVTFHGFEPLDDKAMEQLRAQIPIKAGLPRDRAQVRTSKDFAAKTLREHAHAYATAEIIEEPGSADDKVKLTVRAEPGPRTFFGPVTIVGNRSVSEGVIRRALTYKEGQPFRLSSTLETQRRLYGLEVFEFVHVDPKLPETRVAEIPTTITVAEGKHLRVQLGVGYGSEERARATIDSRHVNFLGGARMAGVEAKWSSLDRGARVTFTEPHFLRSGTTLNFSGTDWWSDEPTYTSQRYGGRVTLTNLFRGGSNPADPKQRVKNELRTSYRREYERYEIATAALADLSRRDDLIALGLDPRTGRGEGTLGALEIDLERDTTDQSLNARRGYFMGLYFEQAARWLGGTFVYREITTEARHYLQIAPALVIANRLRLGGIAGDPTKIPFSKRYFIGGSTSVRGWGRYQVSPLSASGLPIGGRTLFETSSEARVQLTEKLSGVAFVDIGNVWSEEWHFRFGELRYAVGPGLRYATPIGPIRVDVGFQLNPIPGLLINGAPEKRRWRVHFSIGQAF